ncbi:hypothetical protein NEF87_001349 [Candidatus Lokiarchaeum ossiferum]|uniref:Roadblock/LAMTOR2 domain-containing protein n=1 Tax=Candidatus Lokiarchaeum ossiferum TaxID=2951803 RepID=A0ABY6HR60_9ARCH|nr:hypothetical protein NEF87_001349 [Candidatus Lokiarchaeum sp. B-35]
MSNNDEELIKSISKIIEEAMKENVAIQGFSVGTDIATNIYTKFKPELTDFNENELIASATSFQYISKGLFAHIAKNDLNSSYLTVENHVILMAIVKDVSAAAILNRKLAELEGIIKYQKVLDNLLLKIAAFVETSDYITEDPMVKIMRAIPSATFLAIISKEGLPIKIIDNGKVQGPMVGSQVSALSNLTQVMMKTPMDYTILQGKGANILIVQFDSERILAISIPEHEKSNIGQYLARIKEIITSYEGSSFNF